MPGRRPLDGCLAVPVDHHIPKRSVPSIELKRLDRPDDPLNGRGRQGDVVRVAVHEADVLAVGYDLDDIAAQQRPFSTDRTGPMQDRATLKVSATANERQAVAESLC